MQFVEAVPAVAMFQEYKPPLLHWIWSPGIPPIVSVSLVIPLVVTLIALAGVVVGVYLTGIAKLSRRAIPFSGGVLVGVAIFFVVPEMARVFTWPGALGWASAGFALLWTIDRYVYSVCPNCC